MTKLWPEAGIRPGYEPYFSMKRDAELFLVNLEVKGAGIEKSRSTQSIIVIMTCAIVCLPWLIEQPRVVSCTATE